MKKLLALFLSLFAFSAYAACPNFTDNTTLFAAQLNTALANPCITGGSINGVPVSATSLTNSGGYTQSGTSANTLTGTLNAVAINASGGYTQTGTAGNYLSSISLSANNAPFLAADGTIYAPGTGVRIIDPYGSIYLKNVLLFSATAPTIASGFGTSPSIVNSNGTASFSVNVGTGGTATNGVITLPAATTNWNCAVVNPLSGAGTLTQQSAHTATSVTLTNYTISTDVAVAWTASYVIELNCVAK